MECPHCGRSLTEPEAALPHCPHCSRPLKSDLVAVVKTASVRVAAGDSDRVYRSLEEVPPDVRRQIRQAISGPDSETIVIADERGRQRIFQVISELPPHLQRKVLAALQLRGGAGFSVSRKARVILVSVGLAGLALLLWWVWC